MKRCLLLFAALLFIISSAQSQGTVFGVKGGPSLAFQKWNNFERDPLIAYHIMTYVESLPEYPDDLTLFTQVGLHQRGSALRFRARTFINPNTNNTERFEGFSQRFIFNNVALSAGAKQRFSYNEASSLYYLLGIRGEYTISTNLNSLEDDIPPTLLAFYPVEELVRKFNGGIIVGAGIEFNFAEYVGGLIELTFNQDFTKQYEQLPVNLANGVLQETIIRNSTIELTLGIRLLRKVEYVD